MISQAIHRLKRSDVVQDDVALWELAEELLPPDFHTTIVECV